VRGAISIVPLSYHCEEAANQNVLRLTHGSWVNFRLSSNTKCIHIHILDSAAFFTAQQIICASNSWAMIITSLKIYIFCARRTALRRLIARCFQLEKIVHDSTLPESQAILRYGFDFQLLNQFHTCFSFFSFSGISRFVANPSGTKHKVPKGIGTISVM